MALPNYKDRTDLLREMNGGLPSLDGRRTLKPTYQLKEMRSHHREIVRLLAAGFKKTEVAEQLGLHKQTIVNVSNNPIVMRQIQMLQEAKDANASEVTTLDKIRPDAVRALDDLVNDVDEKAKSVRLGAAREILDRTDGKPVQEIKTQNTSIILAHIQQLKDKAKDIGILSAESPREEVEDAEIVDEEERETVGIEAATEESPIS